MDVCKRTRTAAKSRLTLAANRINNMDEINVSKHELEQLILNFEQKLTSYDEAQHSVELLCVDDTELENEVENSEAFREERVVSLVRARELLQTSHAKVEAEDTASSKSLSTTNAPRTSSFHRANLPQIELPKFSGDHTQWQSFWDKFTAIVHVAEMPAVSKFTYLQSLLRGDALAAISGLALTEANYEIARKLLEQRFGRKERIVFGHIQQLLNLTVPGKSINDLWALYDKLQTHIRSLETLDITGDTYGVILTPLVLHKLPENIRLEWARHGDGMESNLDALLSFLQTEIVRRERSQTFRNDQPSTREPKSGNSHGNKFSTASALHSSGRAGKGNIPKIMCNVCGKGHATSSCYSWKDLALEERKSLCFKKGLCFLCLGIHRIKECKSTVRCKCSGRHHPLLCNGTSNASSENEESIQVQETQSLYIHQKNEGVFRKSRNTVLQTAKVIVLSGDNFRQSINILFDSGSDRSFISSSCARELGLETIGKENISVALFGQAKPNTPKLRNKYVLKLIDFNNDVEELIVTESPMISAPIQKPKLPFDVVERLKREGLKLADGSLVDSDSQITIDVLIGLDYFWQLVKPNVYQITECLSAQETKFGWVVSGSWEHNDRKRSSMSYHFLCRTDIPDNLCSKLWNLDLIGIEGTGTKEEESHCKADAKVLEEFNNSITFEDGRYMVHLPWKNGARDRLVDNKALAVKRSENLSKRLGKEPSLEMGYNNVLHELEESGIVHEVPWEEDMTENTVFYLPHRPVVRESSITSKIRPVFDASAKGYNGISLNDCMETGPNLIPKLIEIMLRFRRWKYGLTADITKAFLQIKVTKEDQDVHRFIWDVNGQRRIMRFDRVIFGNACSPFILNATIKHHLKGFENSRVVSELSENLYVDDWLTGADTEQEIEHMISEARDIMMRGSFPLTKWGSSSLCVSENTIKGFEDSISTSDTPVLKILGMNWETKEDCFYFEADPVMFDGIQFTKRLVLSFIARIFDPMGFLNPFTIMVKIMFQDLWQLGLEWDDPLPTELQDKMSTWTRGFKDISRWKIPRCFCIQSWEGSSNMQLLCFSDASERAFGCCVYLSVSENGLRKMSLVASKVRVAPLKKITLPRLELLGALLAARLLCFVRTALNLPNDISYACYTDSTIVLHWIKADPQKWKQFVRNRVVEIQTLTNPSNWKHVPGKSNPADLLTRGICASELTYSNQWLQGLENLEIEDSNPEHGLDDEDVKDERLQRYDPVLVTLQDTYSPIDFKAFSQLSKVIKVVGWVLRFVNNVKSSLNKGTNKTQNSTLTSDELETAKCCVFKIVQRNSFNEELDKLKDGKVVSKNSPLYKMSPFIDENGLLREGGRLHMSGNYTFNEKHPIILPKCHVTLLLVRFQHQLLKHAGVATLLTSLRCNYLIFGLRVLSKRVCRECVLCQRQDARACNQSIAPLPANRITRSHPFSVVGIDHAGPLYCQDTAGKKHYILLFTCGTIRAVHLELVPSLSLTDFMLAMRKFIARRGLPSTIYSDNAKTFEAASKLVKQFGPASPSWKFSIPLAPWYGGWWERLVRSTKSSLRKSLGRELVTRSELETILYEIEACLNSRPLTYVDEQIGPLTPSHFLLGRNSPFNIIHAGIVPQGKADFCLLDKEHRRALENFWNIWSEDYIRNLPSLGNGRSKTDLNEGSIVLIREEGKPRLKWPMGKVTKLIYSKDGLVRAVSLKTEKGEIVRPVRKLHKLEITDTRETNEISNQTSGVPKCTSRSGRVIKPRNILDL